MSRLDAFEFMPRIPATEMNAASLQALTLQDLAFAGFDSPTTLADPNHPGKVAVQLEKLTQFPDRYSGYKQENGVIVAYMKANEWFAGDEAPFVQDVFARQAMKLASRLRGGSLKPRAYGVFGLVADVSLDRTDRDEMLRDLLDESVLRGLANLAGVVNVVVHDRDPLLPIAKEMAFEPVGPKGYAFGVPDVLQQRYQRDISDLK